MDGATVMQYLKMVLKSFVCLRRAIVAAVVALQPTASLASATFGVVRPLVAAATSSSSTVTIATSAATTPTTACPYGASNK